MSLAAMPPASSISAFCRTNGNAPHPSAISWEGRGLTIDSLELRTLTGGGRIFVNGDKKQESNTSMLIFDCKKLIEWGSTFYTWYPGDVLFTGTPEGVSPVQPGDTMRAEIDPIGEMSVPVRAHKAG